MRRNIMQPFLDYYLKDGPKPDIPRALVYETGADQWHRYDSWPRSCAKDCPETARKLYLLPGGGLGFDPPVAARPFDEYVSDPAKPVPYRQRPTLLVDSPESTWGEWLVDDQRNAASRPDVLVYRTEPLKAPIRIAGQPFADLFASTSGTDSDWVVKLIDVYPDETPNQPKLQGGYQLMIAADIFRGRYREDPANPKPIESDKALPYRIRLPNADHTFLPGHRIMVQVQSSWFPLYDRNPQTFVPNIMFAPPESFVKATQRIWHTPDQASAIELPVITDTAE
jgi:putative CocE/NonD family hydrolase